MSLRHSAQFQPGRGRHAISARIAILLKIFPGSLGILRFEMQLTHFDRGFEVRRKILFAPIELPQNGIASRASGFAATCRWSMVIASSNFPFSKSSVPWTTAGSAVQPILSSMTALA